MTGVSGHTFFMNSKIKLMAWVITLLTLVPPAGMTERDAIPKSVIKSKQVVELLVAHSTCCAP
jgi:hypothetical protein